MSKRLLVFILPIFITACGSSPIQYQAKSMDINKAKEIIEELTWSQHPAWRPSDFEITDKYIAWDYGTTSKTRGITTRIGNSGVAIGGASTLSKNLGDRSYYRSIEKVELLSWMRKFKQWYLVSLTNKNGEGKHILRTRNIEDAKLFTDAMSTTIDYYKNKNE